MRVAGLADRRLATWVGLGLALLVAALLVGPPAEDGEALDPASSGPLGALGLVRTLERLGARVTATAGLPEPGTDVALLLEDRLGEARSQDVAGWVRGGGTLVVADPSSGLVPVPVGGRLEDPRRDGAGCGIDALAGVEQVRVEGVGHRIGTRDRGCLGNADSSYFVVATPLGSGTVVAVGGAGAWVNERLADGDNAVLAGALLAPADGTRVAVLLPSAVGDGTAGLSDLVGDGVKQGLVQLGLAFLLYALWRGRRLGRPVREDQPVELAASELVVAVGNLLQQGRHHGRAADAVRDDVRRRLAERLGLGPAAPPDSVAAIAAERTGLDRERLHALLAPSPVGGDDDLVALAADAHDVVQELSRAR